MIRVELPALIGRLNEICRQGMESSAALCISRQGAEITPAHLLFKLLETPFTDVRQILDTQTSAWGIKATNVEIKHIDLNESMIRAIARQAGAERERRAKAIHAEGEKQAAVSLLEAAQTLSKQPEAMQLRYLQPDDPGGG